MNTARIGPARKQAHWLQGPDKAKRADGSIRKQNREGGGRGAGRRRQGGGRRWEGGGGGGGGGGRTGMTTFNEPNSRVVRLQIIKRPQESRSNCAKGAKLHS